MSPSALKGFAPVGTNAAPAPVDVQARGLEPISNDDCHVILQDWSESNPDELVGIRLANELLKARADLAALFEAASVGHDMKVDGKKPALYFGPDKAERLRALLARVRGSK